MGRKLRSHLDLLHPNLEQMVHIKQWQRKHFYKGNRNSMIDLYNVMRVYVHNYNRGRPWVAGVVQSKTGPVSYPIKLEDGRVVKRHLDQIQKTLQSERHERGEPEDLLVEPIHPLDKPCSRAMVPVLYSLTHTRQKKKKKKKKKKDVVYTSGNLYCVSSVIDRHLGLASHS